MAAGAPPVSRAEQWIRDAYGSALARPSYRQFRQATEVPGCAQQIELDLHRTFLDERLATGNEARREALRRVLIAHALATPQLGYMQGMHSIAGVALLPEHTEANPPNEHDEERAFWLLHWATHVLLEGFFEPGLTSLMTEQALLGRIVHSQRPEVDEQLARLGTSVALLPSVASWFLTCFMHEGILHSFCQAHAMDAFCARALTPLSLVLSIVSEAAGQLSSAQDMCAVVDTLQREAHSLRAVEVGLNCSLPPQAQLVAWRAEERSKLEESARDEAARRSMASRYRAAVAALPTSRPEWLADSATKLCGMCALPFTLVRRRHHCRVCGRIFCDGCSSTRVVLPQSLGYGAAAQRVCLRCNADVLIVRRSAKVEARVV